MITQVLSAENMKQAYAQVLKNKGAAGIDNRSVNELLPYLKMHWSSTKCYFRFHCLSFSGLKCPTLFLDFS
jgi:hypothetical protein